MPSVRTAFTGKINSTSAEECVEIVDVVIALKYEHPS